MYCIHFHRFLKRETEQKFWTFQAAILKALRVKWGLIAVWVFVHPSCDMTLACVLHCTVNKTGWILSTNDVYYPDLGDRVADSGTFFIGIHKGSTAPHAPVCVFFQPTTKPNPLASFIYAPFNKHDYSVSVSWHHGGLLLLWFLSIGSSHHGDSYTALSGQMHLQHSPLWQESWRLLWGIDGNYLFSVTTKYW